MELKELIELDKLNKKRFKDDLEYYDFLMFQIQSHMVEIDDLKSKKDPHITKEAADIAILAHMLALHEGANKTIFKERVEKTKGKIKESLNNDY